jgi:V/A-type H+-transporting ATPase subunit A
MLEGARLLREGYLRQSAAHPTDAFCSIKRQEKMLSTFLFFMDSMAQAAERGISAETIIRFPGMETLLRLKEIPEQDMDAKIESLRNEFILYVDKAG